MGKQGPKTVWFRCPTCGRFERAGSTAYRCRCGEVMYPVYDPRSEVKIERGVGGCVLCPVCGQELMLRVTATRSQVPFQWDEEDGFQYYDLEGNLEEGIEDEAYCRCGFFVNPGVLDMMLGNHALAQESAEGVSDEQ